MEKAPLFPRRPRPRSTNKRINEGAMPLRVTESCGFMIVNDRHSAIAARDDRVSMLRLRGKAKLRRKSQVLVDEIESAILADRSSTLHARPELFSRSRRAVMANARTRFSVMGINRRGDLTERHAHARARARLVGERVYVYAAAASLRISR